MAAIITWAIKFLGGFKFWGGSVPFERLGKILFVAVICAGIGFGFWKVFLEKKISKIESYYNCNVTQVHPVQCPKEDNIILFKLWKFRLLSLR